MRLAPAIQQLAELGWTLHFEDFTSANNRPCSIVYAVRGSEKIRIEGLANFIKMSKATFAQKLAELPQEEAGAA